jgi:hypothetical protein
MNPYSGKAAENRAAIAHRPLACNCGAYEWVHRLGFGWCKVESQLAKAEQNLINLINTARRGLV